MIDSGAGAKKKPSNVAANGAKSSSLLFFEPQADGFLRLFAEEDIGAPKSFARQTASVVSPFLKFASVQDRMKFVRQRIAQLGFDSLSYVVVKESVNQKATFALTSYESRAWLLDYFRERYIDVDPRVTDASPTGLPFLWSTAEMRAGLPLSQVRNERLSGLIDKLDEGGRKSGMVIHTPLPDPDVSAYLFFNSEINSSRWMTDTLVAETLMFAHTIHEFIWTNAKIAIGIVDAPKNFDIPLSEMQYAILQAVVQGRRDKEIAYFLGLSPHTVDYHLRRLRQLFNVRNRVQLINIARAQLR